MSQNFWNILSLIQIILVGCASQHITYNVYPVGTCPTDDDCFTLSVIASETDRYFTSNVTLVLHSGDHSLYNEAVSVANVRNLTLQGYSSSSSSGPPSTRILCVNSSLSFTGVSELHIASINLVSCRSELSFTASVFQDCSFENSTAVNGGAIAVYNGSDVHFVGSTTFTGNQATMAGGAVYADKSILSFLAETNFIENQAGVGGAFYAQTSTSVSFSGDSIFVSNTAIGGGALSANISNSLNFTGTCNFVNNTAEYLGGAILVNAKGCLIFTGNISFEGNTAEYGGALTVIKSTRVTFGGSIEFSSGVATYGGALYIFHNNTMIFNSAVSFDGNSAESGGAIIAHESNTFSFNGHNNFEGNKALSYGGAVYIVWRENDLHFIGDSKFTRNAAFQGGGLFVNASNTLNFSGNSKFLGNIAGNVGGAFYFRLNNRMNFEGNKTFKCNTASDAGGAVFAGEYNSLSFSGNSNFQDNTAEFGGTLNVVRENYVSFTGSTRFDGSRTQYVSALYSSTESSTGKFTSVLGGAVYVGVNNMLIFNGYSSFEDNKASEGGVLYSNSNNKLIFNGSCTFRCNMAKHSGGALSGEHSNTLSFIGNCSFRSNMALLFGGAINLVGDSEVYFIGNALFYENTALLNGGAVAIQDSNIITTGKFEMIENVAKYGGGIFVYGGRMLFQGHGSMLGNNSTHSGYGGAILVFNGKVQFNGSYQITLNTADFGGGLAFFGTNEVGLLLNSNTNMFFSSNTALRRGGAIYVDDSPFDYCQSVITHSCFFLLQFQATFCNQFLSFDSEFQNVARVTLTFEDNTAMESGNAVYGGSLEHCVTCSVMGQGTSGSEFFLKTTNVNFSSQLEVSSSPNKVCICENNQPNCTLRMTSVQVYPGQLLSISVVAVGQMDGVVPSVIRAEYEGLIITPDFKVTQPTKNSKDCTQFQYPLWARTTNASLKLYSDEPCSTYGLPLRVLITFLPCPVGFTLSDQGDCVCEERLQLYTRGCQIQNRTIHRGQGEAFWVGLDYHSESEGLILHPHCPFDYCNEEPVDFTLNRTDKQCTNGRSGVLCGACQSGHSLALGSSRCLSDCSNHYLALLLAFAVAGIALVAFLFLCRLTVTQGTLSGLIFYANVLAINQSIFFPPGSTNILTVFIAWLNLDIGIETCFFVSLDTYSRTWLQFVFPIYIWVLVGLIIYFADTSTVVAKIVGRTNPTAVAVTVLLLSYTKLLRVIMVAFSFTILDYPNNEGRLVWLYDGNIGYLDKHDGRHIALFLFSLLVLLFIFLPYTLLLLCGQWVLRKLQFSWISPTKQRYLKAFLKAYYAPFTDKYHYWTGLLLIFRCVILLISTVVNIFSPEDLSASLVAVLGIVSGMLVWVSLVAVRLYKKWYLDILEASFIVNLTALIGGTYQVRLSGGNQTALVYTSVAIAFATFTGIVISSVVYQVKKVVNRRHRATHQPTARTYEAQVTDEDELADHSTSEPVQYVTYSVLEMPPPHALGSSGYVELTQLQVAEIPETD